MNKKIKKKKKTQMERKFLRKYGYIEYTIIPKLKEKNLATAEFGDTILISIDKELYDIEFAQQIHNAFEKVFPENSVISVCKGIEVEVIKNND